MDRKQISAKKLSSLIIWVFSVLTASNVLAAPAVPSSVTATLSGYTINVSWASVAGATRYEIVRNGTVGTLGNTLSYHDNSVIAGTSYGYGIRACDSTGCSAWRNAASVVIPIATSAPAAPAGIYLQGFGALDQTFTAPRKLDSNLGAPTFPPSSMLWSTSGINTVLGNTANQYCREMGFATAGNFSQASDYGNGHHFYTPWRWTNYGGNSYTKLTQVHCVSNSSGASWNNFISWNPVGGASSYELQRNGVTIVSGSTPYFRDTTAASGVNYNYRVRACAGSNCSVWRETPPLALPPPPTPATISVSNCNGIICISWGAASTATSYQLQRNGIDIANLSTTAYSDETIYANVAYIYRVRACVAANCSSWKEASSFTLPLASISTFTATLSGTSVSLNWSNVTNTTYEIERNGTFLKSVVNGVSHTDTSLTPGIYTYRVRACSNGVCSGWATAPAVTLAPAAPASLGYTVNGTTVTLAWSAVIGATSYKIVRNGSVFDVGNVTSYLDSTGVAGTSYGYGVSACVGSACSAWVNRSVYLAPLVPANMTAAFNGSSISLSWSASSGANNYEVQRNGAALTSGNITSYSDASLSAATNYTYRVRACLSDACSGWKDASVVSVPPAIPATMTATLSGSSASLNWSAAAGAASYEVQRNGSALTTGNFTTYTDSSLAVGSYTYRVRACFSGVCSNWKEAAVLTVLPAVPAALTAISNGVGGVSLVWSASSGASNYEIQRNGSALTSGSTTTYTDNAVTIGSTYTYRVRACSGVGCSAWKEAAALILPPNMLSLLTVTPGASSISLHWGSATGATTYELQRNGITLISAPISGYGDTSIQQGVGYVYRVRACNATNCSDWKTASSVSIALFPPASLTATLNGQTANLSWTAVPSATSYEVQRNDAALTSGNITSYTDSSLAYGVNYIYKVRACLSGTCSAWKAATSIFVSPAAPTSLGYTVNGTVVTLNWAAATGATSYKVVRNGTSSMLGNVTTYTDSAATPATSYSYTVLSCVSGVCTSGSNLTVYVPPVIPPSISAVLSGTSVALNWSSSNGATSYEVQRNGVALTSGNLTSYTDSSLTPNIYTYRVRACMSGVCSGWKDATTVTLAPAAPASLNTSLTGTTITLTWPVSAGATSYKIVRNGSVSNVGNVTSYTDSTLTAGSGYGFGVSACIGTVCSAWIERSVNVAPVTPSTMTAVVNASSISLSWPASSGANNYEVQRNGVALTSGNITSYSDSSISTATSYTYKVRACLSGACSAWKEAVAVVPPQVPATITPIVNSASIFVTWTASTGATNYQVQRNSIALTVNNTPGYSDTSAAVGVSYVYRVRACFSDVCSAWKESNAVVMPPLAPTGLTSVLNGSSIVLNWESSAGATSYKVYLNGQLTTVTGNTYSYPNAQAGIYTFFVHACANNACSASTSTKYSLSPQIPSTFTAVADGSSVKLNWSVSSGANRYELLRGPETVLSANSSTSFTDSVAFNTSYIYKVRACWQATNVGSVCSEWKETTVTTLAEGPANLNAGSHRSSVLLNWLPTIDATYYKVVAGNKQYIVYSNTIKMDNIPYGQVSYQVAACGLFGCTAYKKLDYSHAPAAPAVFSVSAYENAITANWYTSEGATEYVLTRNGVEIWRGAGNSYKDTNLLSETSYTYAVAACANGICSAFKSNTTGTQSLGAVARPESIAAVATSKGVRLSWPKPRGARTYRVNRFGGTSPTPFVEQVLVGADGGITSTDDRNVTPGQTYHYTVKACLDDKTTCSELTYSSGVWIPTSTSDDIVDLMGTATIPASTSPKLGQASNFGLPASNIKVIESESAAYDLIVMNKPNVFGISYNKITNFEANKPLKIINTKNNESEAASLIIIDAFNIGLHSSIELVGETADILFLARAPFGGSWSNVFLNCLSCTFQNFGRVTLANASLTLSASSTKVGILDSQSSSFVVHNLSAPGVASVELIGRNLSTYGVIDTQLRAKFNYANGGYDVAADGGFIVGSGGVNIFNGGLIVDYETLDIKRVQQSTTVNFIKSKITSGAVRITTSSPLVISNEISTKSDILATNIYRNKLTSVLEAIEINNVAPVALGNGGTVAKNINGNIYINAPIKSDFKVAINSTGDVYLNNEMDAKDVTVITAGKIANTRKSKLVATTASLAGDKVENNGQIRGENLTIVAENDIQNRFGGKILGSEIKIASNSSIVRNGSQYPFQIGSQYDPMMDLADIYALSRDGAGAETTSLSTIGSLNVAGAIKVADLSAHIIGNNVTIDAAAVENINPYYLYNKNPSQWVNGVEFDTSATYRVMLLAEDKLAIKARIQVVNSSAIMGVNKHTEGANNGFIITAPNVYNERYFTRVLADVITENRTIITNTSTQTTTTDKLQSNLYVYSPPGLMYSFAPISMSFAGGSTSNGFVNNTSYFEAFNGASFAGSGKVVSRGLALEEENHNLVTSMVNQQCGYWGSGGIYMNAGPCSYTTTNATSGTTIATDMERTLFSIAGGTNAPEEILIIEDHQFLDELKQKTINTFISQTNYSWAINDLSNQYWDQQGIYYEYSYNNTLLTITQVFKKIPIVVEPEPWNSSTPPPPPPHPEAPTRSITVKVWDVLVNAFGDAKASLIHYMDQLEAWWNN